MQKVFFNIDILLLIQALNHTVQHTAIDVSLEQLLSSLKVILGYT